jgi:hydroxymethylglutaryl-CoA reductase (NADPH)
MTQLPGIPRDRDNDYSQDSAAMRRDLLRTHTGAHLHHAGQFSFDPGILPGNIENFTGVAQIPIGLAGPVLVNGEHARGMFYVPMATTEGTLVASYSRGMKVMTACGGVRVTVVEDYMQRSPVFEFNNALEARDFGDWVRAHMDGIRAAAESTTHSGRLSHIEQYAVGPLRYLRFNFSTRDAAGQNMVSKATLAACEWIRAHHPGRLRYILSGNIDTDKKHSLMNTLHTRGKRVVAEITLKRELMQSIMGVDTHSLFRMRQISNAGAMLAGSASNGSHVANGVAAVFIATGQDAANVAESQAGITYAQLLENGDYYWSVTLSSLIVATCGGGTGLPTQKECLDIMGCHGEGKALKLAEIIGATVLAGEISLSSAILAGDWVSSHDQLGRNRP